MSLTERTGAGVVALASGGDGKSRAQCATWGNDRDTSGERIAANRRVRTGAQGGGGGVPNLPEKAVKRSIGIGTKIVELRSELISTIVCR